MLRDGVGVLVEGRDEEGKKERVRMDDDHTPKERGRRKVTGQEEEEEEKD